MTSKDYDTLIASIEEAERHINDAIAASAAAPLCCCSHPATQHAVDDEELRECAGCACLQYDDAAKADIEEGEQ